MGAMDAVRPHALQQVIEDYALLSGTHAAAQIECDVPGRQGQVVDPVLVSGGAISRGSSPGRAARANAPLPICSRRTFWLAIWALVQM